MNLPILIFPPKVDELADVWSQFVETELRHECYDEALSYLKRATTAPGHKPSYFDRTESVQNRVLFLTLVGLLNYWDPGGYILQGVDFYRGRSYDKILEL